MGPSGDNEEIFADVTAAAAATTLLLVLLGGRWSMLRSGGAPAVALVLEKGCHNVSQQDDVDNERG